MRPETWEALLQYIETPWVHAALVLVVSVVAAFLVELFVRRTLLALAARTATDLDDKIIHALRRPIIVSVLLVGAALAVESSTMSPRAQALTEAALKTVATWLWSMALIGVGGLLLKAVGQREKEGSLVQARTVPIFDFLLKVGVITLAGYFLLLVWHIDITAWIASAGIAGIAIGFAAQSSLANLFAGIFILADGPYKIGDTIILDDGLRGVVTNIGIRSTRVLTKDGVEVIIPNAIIGESKIVNQTGGPNPKLRVCCSVSAAYGSDVDQVREVLLSVVENVPHVVSHPRPTVHFKAFGASGLDFELLCWIVQPVFREETESELNFRVYKAFAAAGIEIPYSKHDIYIKEMPSIGAREKSAS